MFGRLIFKYLSRNNQIERLREKGIILGTRYKKGKKVLLYLLNDFCVEVTYTDLKETDVQSIRTFSNVAKFNNYLENEFRAASF